MDKLQKNLDITVKSVNEEARTIDFVVSSESEDRYGDTMVLAGMDADNFMKNAVMPWGHDYHGLPVAVFEKLWVEGTKLIGRAKFAGLEQMHDKAETVFRLYRDGFLKAVSIGFKPTERTENETGGYKFLKWELLEISAVTIPANPEALMKAAKKGIGTEAELKEIFSEEKTAPVEEVKKEVAPVEEAKAGDEIEEKDLLAAYRKQFDQIAKLLGVETDANELKSIENTGLKAVSLLAQRVIKSDDTAPAPAKAEQSEKKGQQPLATRSAKAILSALAN